jgi:branched-chain amino acid transport system substrate-binding protein
MNSRAIVPLIVVAIVAWFLFSRYQQGKMPLPGLPNPAPITSATDPNTTDPNATGTSTTTSGVTDPNATDPNATDPNATDPNATDPNATDPNATDPNATDPNATDPNATDPNAQVISTQISADLTDPISSQPTKSMLALQAMRDGSPAARIVLADEWLKTHPTDALFAIERSNALTKVLNKPALELGFSAPLSGPLKQVGEAFLQGTNLAIQEANQAGGIGGKRINLTVLNDGGDKAQAIEVASKLLSSDALGVIGPYSSSTTLASSEIYNQGLPIIAPAATNPKVSSAGPYIFRVAPSDLEQGSAMARLVLARGHKAVAVLFDENDAYSKGLADAFSAEAERIGLQVSPITFTLNSYTTAKVGNYAVDAMFISGYTPDVAMIAKLESLQPREIFAGDGAYGQDLIAQGGEAVNGVIVSSFWHATLTDPASVGFTKKFQNRYGGGTPNANAMQAYDATRTMLEAIKRSKIASKDTPVAEARTAIKTALEGFRTKPGVGVTAPVKFDVNGDVIGRPFVAIQVKDGKFVAIGLAK